MRMRFTLRAMFLAVFIVAALLAFCTPVARINPVTCARILPGMSEEQACGIVGAPPGWYDGLGGVSSDAPAEKGYKPFWIGLRGQIEVDLDESGRVAKAAFYPTRTIGWSLGAYFWERFTRVKFMGLSVPARIALFFGLTAVATFLLGIVVVPVGARNAAASHGTIGLVLGVIFAAAMFSEDFISSLFVTAVALLGPVLGAIIGILIGIVRGCLAPQPVRRTTNPEPTIPVTAT